MKFNLPIYLSFILFFVAVSANSSENDDDKSKSTPCDANKCKIPDCRCSGTDIPGGFQMADTPQMIVLTFQNGIRKLELAKYQSLFAATRNPNGCPGTGTFFVSHENTDYFTVQTLRSERHEIAVNGVNATHSQDWWSSATKKQWQEEMEGQKKILILLSNVSSNDITGMRAPYLQMGGDNQISGLKKSKLDYDASRVSTQFANSPNILWPYTYDYSSTQDCVVRPCPEKSAKGIWQVPLLALTDKSGHQCSTLDACDATTASDVFALLYKAFYQHYLSNKAPLVLTLSARWVQDSQKMAGTTAFLSYLIGLKDVYLVSADRMLAWIKNPTKLNELSSFEPFQCNQSPPSVCAASEAITCRYDGSRKFVSEEAADVRYRTTTCLKVCPKCYPWVNDPDANSC